MKSLVRIVVSLAAASSFAIAPAFAADTSVDHPARKQIAEQSSGTKAGEHAKHEDGACQCKCHHQAGGMSNPAPASEPEDSPG
jgi:hypothetical protein